MSQWEHPGSEIFRMWAGRNRLVTGDTLRADMGIGSLRLRVGYVDYLHASK